MPGKRRFHVRVERRGHKGEIDSHVVEQGLSERLHAALAARGAPPTFDFTDPDVVLSVQLIGDVGGIGLITRELRARHAFARVD